MLADTDAIREVELRTNRDFVEQEPSTDWFTNNCADVAGQGKNRRGRCSR